jgi:hypothetical protein
MDDSTKGIATSLEQPVPKLSIDTLATANFEWTPQLPGFDESCPSLVFASPRMKFSPPQPGLPENEETQLVEDRRYP